MRQFRAAWDRLSADPARLAEFVEMKLTRSGFALLQVLFRAAQLHRDSGEQRLSDHLRAILRVRHGDVGATRDSFGDLRLRHDTARFERVADDLDQAKDRAIAACNARRKLADLSFEHSNPHLVLFFHRCPFERSFRIC